MYLQQRYTYLHGIILFITELFQKRLIRFLLCISRNPFIIDSAAVKAEKDNLEIDLTVGIFNANGYMNIMFSLPPHALIVQWLGWLPSKESTGVRIAVGAHDLFHNLINYTFYILFINLLSRDQPYLKTKQIAVHK